MREWSFHILQQHLLEKLLVTNPEALSLLLYSKSVTTVCTFKDYLFEVYLSVILINDNSRYNTDLPRNRRASVFMLFATPIKQWEGELFIGVPTFHYWRMRLWKQERLLKKEIFSPVGYSLARKLLQCTLPKREEEFIAYLTPEMMS